ncbi:DUF4127 family protein [Pelosinus propionicus]|uniref:DUF4127 family protein n=1 Tax=Pelosinus propionicus DSM 13327 TaxID=1123291 RepID=A0A1I4L9T9_9FIRM|nr:DUF4127 family protein [Pelosinus propionicus]SFL87639.1 Protein of unknown function [Pelosinus propionicus DSM 13327]
MSKNFKYFVLIISFFIATTSLLHISPWRSDPIMTWKLNVNYWLTVVLLPLDSRPPCTQFVEQLGQITGIRVLLPQQELLDNYQTPANKKELRIWLRQVSSQADAAIISTDMLIHGSLLASRLSMGSNEDTNEVLDLLTVIHQENPYLKMYAFNIIPRLLIADNQENITYQRNMLKYSVIKDQVYTFENAEDIKTTHSLEKQLPANVIQHYTALYEKNTTLNLALLNMVEQGTLAGLVIGQDDGQPFGIPNMNKQQLQHQLSQKPSLANKVFITRGTDEVAISLLGHIVMENSNDRPKVFVMYSDHDAAQIIMPFMPHTVAKTVQEKMRIAGAVEAKKIDDADFILYIHVGTSNNQSTFSSSAEQVRTLLDQGYRVALVDLTEHFQVSETLLPVLLAQKVAIPKLIAYAGWNTTSNSIGTAVTQASIFTKALKKDGNLAEIMAIYKENLEFLTARFLDDLYYQKEINPYINKQLQRRKIDPYHLQTVYYQTNIQVQKMMVSKANHLLREGLVNYPITIRTDQGLEQIIITDLETQTYLPWQRTFEIWIKPTLALTAIKKS